MTDLVQFLRDRLDEDEQTARATTWDEHSDTWTASPHRANYETHMVWDYLGGAVATIAPENADPESVGRHIARYGPARALREVEAKRRILDDVLPTMQADELRIAGEWGVGVDPVREASDDLLSLLALPYSDHPDFRPEWAPDQA